MWGAIVQAVLPGLISGLEPFYRDYINGRISHEQLLLEGSKVLLGCFQQLDAALLDSITKTFTSFWQANNQNAVMQHGWAIVLYSQLFVLIWHQWVIPLVVTLGLVKEYATSGATVNWAYALVALCLGAPAIASRVGPAANWAADNLSRILKR